ncbi:hypothetical protein J2S97_004548, partial [Arthrobacter oryzae]|nr:hypothetical protein [Arthrobacter oryzae]
MRGAFLLSGTGLREPRSGVVMTDNGSVQERCQKCFFRLEN